MREEELLINRLKAYKDSRIYPFHMPGHKRLQLGGIKGETARSGMDFPNPFFVDITEVEGFDNLHHAQGILKQSMEWAARVYGADRTWYLINGSTCGILASVCGCTRPGGHILMSRNCHKAAYHAAYINHLRTSYVYPQDLPGLGIQGGILPEDVEKALEEHRDIQAVFIVSPTYDGVVSDVVPGFRVGYGGGCSDPECPQDASQPYADGSAPHKRKLCKFPEYRAVSFYFSELQPVLCIYGVDRKFYFCYGPDAERERFRTNEGI